MNRSQACTLLLFLLFFNVGNLYGQGSYGHEWIKPGQLYFRIPVTQNGFYKIEGKELLKAGIPVDSIPHRSFQIFRRGRELACEIKPQTNEYIGTAGSVAFYGEKNDGARDSLLYVTPGTLPHSAYSLYSDTASYFLTWRMDGGSGARIRNSENPVNEDLTNYHFEESLQLFTAYYAPGQFYPPGSNFDTGTALSTYDVGEGWTGPEIKQNEWGSFSLQTSHAVIDQFQDAYVELVVVGRSAGEHKAEIWSGTKGKTERKITSFSLSDYNATSVSIRLDQRDITMDGKVHISVTSVNNSGSISVSLVRWHYPQRIDLEAGFSQKSFYFNASQNGKTIYLNDMAGSYFDCSDIYNIKEIKPERTLFRIDGTRKMIAVRVFLTVAAIVPVHFKLIDPSRINYLMISHPSVRLPTDDIQDPVEAYAAYRSSLAGGGYLPMIVNSQEVYDQFNYGEPGPLGIRNMIRWLTDLGNLKFVLLVGRSVDPQTARKLPRPREADMVPNTGWPGSDLALSMPVSPNASQVPGVPVGRINASTPDQVWSYLQKVKVMEAEPASAPWRKHILHLSGGRSRSELALFRQYVDSFGQNAKNSFLAASVATISKKTYDPVEQFPLDIPVNKGIALMTLFGHSGVNITDLDIGYVSDVKRNYKNKPFYPAVIVNGCATGSIFYSPSTISSDWIFAPNSGSVLFLAHTFNGISTSLKNYTASIYQVLADSNFTTAPFGVIQKEAIRRTMANRPTLADIMTAQQMNLHGDPAIRLFPARKADYAFDTTLFRISATDGKRLTTESDSMIIRLGIMNLGRYIKGKFRLQLLRKMGAHSEIYRYTYPSFGNADTLLLRIPNDQRFMSEEQWTFTLDPENEIPEDHEHNNVLYREIIIPEQGAIPLLPVPDFATDKAEIELIALVPDDHIGASVTFEWAFSEDFSNAQRISATSQGLVSKYRIKAPDYANQQIYWRVHLTDFDDRPSRSRSIRWSEKGISGVPLPEAVMASQQNNRQVHEGDLFTTTITIQNAKDIPFTDSVTIQIIHIAHDQVLKRRIKIAPLAGNEIREMDFDFATQRLPGEHSLEIRFNATELPEEIFTNNSINLTFQVIPDDVPPTLSVYVDGRHITDQEAVSAQPEFAVEIIDENPFLIRKDASDIEVFLTSDCTNCENPGVILENTATKTTRPNVFTLHTKPRTALTPGMYTLRVTAQDLAANLAIPYEVTFRIQDTVRVTLAGAAPNPASWWFRFFADLEGPAAPAQWIITITDQRGQQIRKITTKPHTGKNEIFWEPSDLPSGIFLYRMEFQNPHYPPSTAAAAGMSGKLIWIP
jgi:hypothetical protein